MAWSFTMMLCSSALFLTTFNINLYPCTISTQTKIMIPLDQHVGVDVMINPPLLVNFHNGKITNITQDMTACNSDVFLYISYSKENSKTDLFTRPKPLPYICNTVLPPWPIKVKKETKSYLLRKLTPQDLDSSRFCFTLLDNSRCFSFPIKQKCDYNSWHVSNKRTGLMY